MSPAPQPRHASATTQRSVRAVAFAVVTALCVPAAYYTMFTAFHVYDDEGFFLLSLRQYLQGGALYDHLFAQYGPAYFELVASVFRLLRLATTHTNGRAVTMVVWLASSLLCGIATQRLTRKLPLALCTQLLVFAQLQSLRNEPLHPGGLLCLILSAVVVAGSFLEQTPRAIPAAVIGALLALVALMKINIGLLALASTVFALVVMAPATRRWQTAKLGAAALLLITTPVLMASSWMDEWVRAYAALVTSAALAVIVIELAFASPHAAAPRNLGVMLVASLLVGVVVCAVQLARGTSAAGLVDGVLLYPLRQPHTFSQPLQLPSFAVWIAGVSTFVAVMVVLGRRTRFEESLAGMPMAATQLLGGGLIWLSTFADRPETPFAVALPLLWIALLPRTPSRDASAPRVGHFLLAAIAVLQALHAYPVAGSQIAWATFLFIPVGAVAIAEGWDGMRAAASGWLRRDTRPLSIVAGCAALAMIALVFDVRVVEPGRRFKDFYDHAVPLDLPGTTGIRVQPMATATYQWLTHSLSTRCRSFISLPGLNSLYLFTGFEPPSMVNATHWMTLLSADEQARQRDRFAQMPGPLCVVRNRQLVKFWTAGHDVSGMPLMRYIDEDFVTVDQRRGYELLMERPQHPAVAP